MRAAQSGRIDEDEYLSAEAISLEKHEWFDGHVYAMAGASPEHNLVCANLLGAIAHRTRRRCVALTSDQRIYVPTGLYTYPDVSVVCGPIERHPRSAPTLLNPTLLVEVLSKDTEGYDRGDKFAQYRQFPSLRAVLFVSVGERRLELYTRTDVGVWQMSEATGHGAIRVPALDVELPLEEVFADLDLLAAPEA